MEYKNGLDLLTETHTETQVIVQRTNDVMTKVSRSCKSPTSL